jgi:acetylxylan esterase
VYPYGTFNITVPEADTAQMHQCGGSAPFWFGYTKLPSYADSNGFILIYPGTPRDDKCWDINNSSSLTHGKGGDALGIVNMVQYTLTTYNADPSKVYAMGASSGAMMTNVLAGSYPDVFEAGAAFSGVAFACAFGDASPTPLSKNQTCVQGLEHTPEQWAAFVYNAYPGYSGRRTRMMIVHGLADETVRPQAGQEALKQWSTVLNVPLTRNISGVPSKVYTQQIYGDGTQLQGFFGRGVKHWAPVNEPLILNWFGILANNSTAFSS